MLSNRKLYTNSKTDEEVIGNIGFDEIVTVDKTQFKKVLITGEHSFVGESFEKYVKKNYPQNFDIDTISLLNDNWENYDFSKYDVIFHVAGLAHSDIGNLSEDEKDNYYKVNTDLTIKVCKKAKNENVKEFIYMSSMIVYGDSAPLGKNKIISRETIPVPTNFYGDSKLQADVGIRNLASDNFKVIVLRPPMIYGRNSKGNYPLLSKIAKNLIFFPKINNSRSMLYIGNLCELLCQVILIRKFEKESVVLIPQNSEKSNTSNLVKRISYTNQKHIKLLKIFNPIIYIFSKIPGKIGKLINKAFGNSVYSDDLSIYPGLNYQIYSINESVEETELGFTLKNNKKAIILASVASMIDQFNMDNISLLQEHGYTVKVLCNCEDGNTISKERIEKLKIILENKGVKLVHIPIPRNVMKIGEIIKSTKLVRDILKNDNYTLLHCHSPIGSVVARSASRKYRKFGLKIIYTAHGFHFFRGAPLKNWLIYYPIELFYSKFTDKLITINKEDYDFAKKHMKKTNVTYVPGIGIHSSDFKNSNLDIYRKKVEMNINNDEIIILSVGELNNNKNHIAIIKAISKLKDIKIRYLIAGQGANKALLMDTAAKFHVSLELLGYRTDIKELLLISDIYAFPSFREGLSVSLMEAMSSGLPCIVSKIRGNVDLIDDNKGGFCINRNDIEKYSQSISILAKSNDIREKFGRYNLEKIKEFDYKKVIEKMSRIYFGEE